MDGDTYRFGICQRILTQQPTVRPSESIHMQYTTPHRITPADSSDPTDGRSMEER